MTPISEYNDMREQDEMREQGDLREQFSQVDLLNNSEARASWFNATMKRKMTRRMTKKVLNLISR